MKLSDITNVKDIFIDHTYTDSLIFNGASRMRVHEDTVAIEQGTPSVLIFKGHDDNAAILRHIANGIQDDDAVTVGQLNSIIGDIDIALDEIIEIQEGLIAPNGDEVSY